MLTPFLLLPILSRVVGQAGWLSLGVGQALGGVAGTIVLFGWWVVGPARFHELDTRQARRSLFIESLQSRLLVSLIVFPAVGVLVSLLSAPEWRLEAVLMSWATASAGLTPAWYCIAMGSPGLLLRFDAVPKLVATVLSAVLMLLTNEVWVYPVLLLLGTLGATVAFVQCHARVRQGGLTRLNVLLNGLRVQLPVVTSNLVGTIYTATPLPIASALASVSVAAPFTSAERLYRLSKFSIVALANSFQSLVLEKNSVDRYRRHTIALGFHVILGVIGGASITFVGPLFTTWLFGVELGADLPSCLGFGLSFLFLSCSSPLTRNLLIPAGKTTAALRATITGALVGVPLMFLLFQLIGISGIGVGLAFSEAAVFLMLLPAAIHELRKFRT